MVSSISMSLPHSLLRPFGTLLNFLVLNLDSCPVKFRPAHSEQLVLWLCWCLASTPTLYSSSGDGAPMKCSVTFTLQLSLSHGILPRECSLPITPWHPHNWCPVINPPKLNFSHPISSIRHMADHGLLPTRQTLLTGSPDVQDITAMVARHGWHS